MAKKPERTRESLKGRAASELVRRGTASEHTAVVLHTDGGDRMTLQRIGGNAFDDPQTRALAGHEVSVEGFRLGDIFRFVKAEPTSES